MFNPFSFFSQEKEKLDHCDLSKLKSTETHTKPGLSNAVDIHLGGEVIQECLSEFMNKVQIKEQKEYKFNDAYALMRDVYKQCEFYAGRTSSILKCESKDTENNTKEEQREQQVPCLHHQTIESGEQTKIKLLSGELRMETIKERETRDVEVEDTRIGDRTIQAKAISECNKHMAHEKKIKEDTKKRKCKVDSFVTDLINENFDLTNCHLRTGKKIGCMFGVLNNAEKAETILEQMTHFEQTKVKIETGGMSSGRFKTLTEHFNRMLIQNKIIEKKTKENHKEFNKINNALERENRHQVYLEKTFYANVPRSELCTQIYRSHE